MADLGCSKQVGADGVELDPALAYMWVSLAAPRLTSRGGRAGPARAPDTIAKVLTGVQIARATQLAKEWKPKSP